MLAISSSNSFSGLCYHSFVEEVGRKPLRTFVLGHQKQQKGPEYFPLWSNICSYLMIYRDLLLIYVIGKHMIMKLISFFLLEHRWLSYHGRNGALKRQRCWPSRAGIYSRLCLVGYAKNPGKSWFVKGLWWSCTDLPSTLSTSLANRCWIPISLLSWRCGLAGTIPPPAPPPYYPSPTKLPVSQAKSLCKMFPVHRCICVLRKCEMNMEIGQVPFVRVFKREKKKGRGQSLTGP